jgi:hypothetical protein
MKRKLLAIILALSVSPTHAANKLPYLTGLYGKTSSHSFVLDETYPAGIKNEIISSILTYYPYAQINQGAIPDDPYQEGKRVLKRKCDFDGISGYAYFTGVGVLDILTKVVDYTGGVAVFCDSNNVQVHENLGHLSGLAHQDCNYRHIQYRGIWRDTQQYEYGNLSACGVMAYGSTSFTPMDDFEFRVAAGQAVQKGRVRGTITVSGQALKGANLIFISQTKTFMPSNRVLKHRYSTIIDILGAGDGSFEIDLPPDTYQVMLVPIGNYSRGTHGVWRLSDSQIKDIPEPLFLNGKKARLIQDPDNKGVIEITNGSNLSFNWTVSI